MNVIVVANQKGGVGKSTISCNLGVASALSGHKTLIIDGNIVVKNYTPKETGGPLGLNLTGVPPAPANPVIALTILGDITPTDTNAEQAGVQATPDDQFNPIGTAGSAWCPGGRTAQNARSMRRA